ncbi:hypothetical protein [Actinoplanes sp. NPDC051494]|uniref:hypothetical protein n=1 Tax=Actinoplanes sp. NPDC051494 TaxID=3363907 RepID=UPI00379E79E3
MTFTVIPEGLDGYAKQVGRAGEDARSIGGYLHQYPPPDGTWSSGGLMKLLGESGPRAFAAAQANLNKAGTLLDADQDGLTDSAAYYRQTDTNAAVRLDATLPDHPDRTGLTALEQAWAGNVCSPSFADSRDPSGRLTAVGDVELSHPLAFLDNISISHWALKGIDWVFGYDILGEATNFFLGDWQALAKAGKALGNAADASFDLGYNVQGGAISLRTQWQGHAAQAADQHFTDIAATLDTMGHPMKVVAKQLELAAEGAYNAGESVSGIIKGLLDAAIIAGIAAAAGTVTAETGVGAVVGYGVAAIEVTRMLDMWAEATKVMSSVYAATQATIGIAQTGIASLESVQIPEVNGGSYHHPLVPLGPHN